MTRWTYESEPYSPHHAMQKLQLQWMQDSVVLLIRCGVTTIAGASNIGEDIVPTCSSALASAMDNPARNSFYL
ncbi:UNVERIFIED_CONTAM: hypothetical protein NCL1_33550 [Trichonephila clavipes]